MSYVYRYTGADQVLVVKSDERRHDLEAWAYWRREDGVEVPVAKGEHVLTPEAVREAETPTIEVEGPKKPARRTRTKKTVDTEVED